MKNKKFSLLALLALAVIPLSGCTVDLGFIKFKFGDDSTGTNVDGSYYKGYKLNLTGGRLANELQKLCFDKHTKYITYGQVNSYFSKKTTKDGYINSAEAVSDGSTLNQWFYTGKEASGVGTREHVWPCANSGQLWEHGGSGVHDVDNNNYIGGGSDLYHVRTANSAVNTARGNSKFVDFDDPEFENLRSGVVEKGESKGRYVLKLQGLNEAGEYAQKVEVDDEMKGDVARIILYVWVHYGEKGVTPSGSITSGKLKYNYSDMTGKLNLTSILGYDSEKRCKEKLIEWNNLDKPNEIEKLRNNTVQKIQGNRNPFVDRPELVEQLLSDKSAS